MASGESGAAGLRLVEPTTPPEGHLTWLLGEVRAAAQEGRAEAALANLAHAVFVAGTTEHGLTAGELSVEVNRTLRAFSA